MKWLLVGGDHPHRDVTVLVDDDGIPMYKMCCICFEYILIDNLFIDYTGTKWDVCPPCATQEGM